MSDGKQEFEVDGVQFRRSPLKVTQSLKGLNILMGAVLPAFAAKAGASSEEDKPVIRDVLMGLERIDDLVDLCAKSCEVKWQGEKWVPLDAFKDNVFQRKTSLLLAWLTECVFIEYGDFLDEDGQRRLSSLGSRLTSLIGSTGKSGELS